MNDCGICIGGGDYDGSPEFDAITTPRARKPHKCDECRRVIQKGDTYERLVGKYDGNFYCSKTCMVCAEIRDAFNCEGGGYLVGELWTELTSVFGGLTTGCFDRLETVEAKKYLRDRWLRWKGLAA